VADVEIAGWRWREPATIVRGPRMCGGVHAASSVEGQMRGG
jgi:hypothetical protein